MDNELYCPSTDVCGWCGDSECDGIACIASLDPDDPDDHDAIDRLHGWLRRGQLLEQLESVLAILAEMRDKGIHLGLGSPPRCVVDGEVWPCAHEQAARLTPQGDARG